MTKSHGVVLMNDFTKEELMIILADMRFCANKTKLLNKLVLHKQLVSKVESMIDSYCEIKIPTVDDYE